MANNIPFQPMGKTYLANATMSANSITITADSPVNQYLLQNHDNSTSGFVRITSGGGNAALPTAGGEYGLPVRHGETLIITGPQVGPTKNVIVSFITVSGSAYIYITPGEGL